MREWSKPIVEELDLCETLHGGGKPGGGPGGKHDNEFGGGPGGPYDGPYIPNRPGHVCNPS